MMLVRALTLFVLVAISYGVRADGPDSESQASKSQVAWDYSPYRVLIWIASDDPTVNVDSVETELRRYLDRDFLSVWRVDLAPTPRSIRTLAARDMAALDYDAITASDPVLAVKRDHPDAVRIRTVNNVAQYCRSVLATVGRRASVIARAESLGDASIAGVAERLNVVDGDESAVGNLWNNSDTEALLISRGMAMDLADPEAKLITPSVSGLVGNVVDSYDKVFVVDVQRDVLPGEIRVVEIDSLMRHFGPTVSEHFFTAAEIPLSIGRAVTRAFAPVVRIENAGQRSATGLLRARGLIQDDLSPAQVSVGDPLEPMIRKDDRNGTPTKIGRMDWALLLATEIQDRYLKLSFYAGRAGSLQGRKNKRTFRMGLKARPQTESTNLRLHLQGKPSFPLIGYELHEKELDSRKMTFVGRTDWNGRLEIPRTNDPLRLLYVKNGGAVLARLPIVPGLYSTAVADLRGDDLRLQAEAYVRGAQNSITDLVAMRKLYGIRIRKHLEKGEMEQAERMMNSLRTQPTNADLSATIGRKQVEFLERIGTTNIGQRRKVDEMFSTTRELLSKHILPKEVRDLERDLQLAKDNGGKLSSTQTSADVVPQAGATSETTKEP